jgi:signal transduction histidine kinase
MRRAFFYLRIALLALTLACVALLVIQLYRLNVFLRNLAESAKRELVIARTNLSEVQGFLQNARFQRSLFEMVAGLAHELNTPLGNCLGAKVADLRAGVRAGGLSRDGFDRAMGESLGDSRSRGLTSTRCASRSRP